MCRLTSDRLAGRRRLCHDRRRSRDLDSGIKLLCARSPAGGAVGAGEQDEADERGTNRSGDERR